MSVRIIRGPFILRETIGMIYNYMNGVSFHSALRRRKAVYGAASTETSARWSTCLQDIMEQVCKDLDVTDLFFRRFFLKTTCGNEEPCLADLLATSFVTLEHTGFWENVEEVRGNWWILQRSGSYITTKSTASLQFESGAENHCSLFKQVLALNYPAEFRLNLYDVLSEFDSNLYALAKAIEPYAQKLDRLLEQESWLLDEVCGHMESFTRERNLLELIADIASEDYIQGAGEETWLAPSLMRGNILYMAMAGPSVLCKDHNSICMGCFVTPYSSMHRKVKSLEGICATLKCLSDQRRLEILQKLSRERSYCMELAENMGADTGNMSRALAMLHSYGFLTQEKEVSRTYYRTDRQVIHEFLEILENTLCGEE